MELTPELLLEAKFGPARRGYDMAEVDDFLERCAEGLDVLLARLKAEFERAENAEARLAEFVAGSSAARVDETIIDTPAPISSWEAEAEVESPPPAEESAGPAPAVDEPMRILVHAERTAEAAIADARAEAERIRTEAESVATQHRSEAENLLATATAEAEEEARKAGDETKRMIQAEVSTLRRDRDGLSDDIRSLRRWLDEQRTRMRSTARELQRLVEDPSGLQDVAVPDLSTPTEPIDETASADGAAATPAFAPSGGDVAEPTQAIPAIDSDPADDDPWTRRQS